ncbi:glycosyltransferase [Pseudomonas luteola]|uniref:glycosyltransferase n=1 Tax=Pseudomonas luteola TaxID=47886 RepID=UPI00389001C9
MKILIVITSLGVGGAERLTTALADKYLEKGHEVKIAFLTGQAILTPKNKSVTVINLKVRSFCSLINSYFHLRRIMISYRPDVVHSHLVHANLLTRLVRLSTSFPKLISSSHSNNEGGKARMLAYRATDFLADISTNVSDSAVSSFIKKGAARPGRMITVYNGISTEDFSFSSKARESIREELGIEGKIPVILAVGRLDAPKDYPNLINALSVIYNKKSYFKVLIAGDGPLKKELQALTKSLGLDNCITFLGIRNDIPNLMSACDVFSLSSAWEGFGLVVAEAMACERVVVATDCGGVAEVLGSTGFIVPPKNSIALAESLYAALALTDAQKAELGFRARERIKDKYSIESVSEKWLSLYKV